MRQSVSVGGGHTRDRGGLPGGRRERRGCQREELKRKKAAQAVRVAAKWDTVSKRVQVQESKRDAQ
jgi:hypothetical protein